MEYKDEGEKDRKGPFLATGLWSRFGQKSTTMSMYIHNDPVLILAPVLQEV